MGKKNNSRTYILMILGVIGTILLVVGVTYAYWILTKQQTGENVVNSACLNISFTGENDINLPKAYPMSNDQLDKFLSTATPYHFTIHNECNELASASINLESLTVSGKALEDEYIDAVLYEDDYNSNLNSIKKLTSDILNDENKVIIDAKHAYSLYNFNLKPDETRDFNLLLYMDPQTPMEEDNMNASWKGKITLSTEYKEDSRALRTISATDNQGMWGYKDKVTKIVIENTKSVKQAPEGGKVYGPFDESEYRTKAVESYVVCEADDSNCVGYLQSNGKIVANPNSALLFMNFNKVTEFENISNLDTSKVINMSSMFSGMSQLLELDLSSWDTSHVIWSSAIFSQMTSLETLNLSNFKFPEYCNGFFAVGLSNLNTLILNNVDTTSVTNMSNMFNNCKKITSLDLSNFDTSNVNKMDHMFDGTSSLTINYFWS